MRDAPSFERSYYAKPCRLTVAVPRDASTSWRWVADGHDLVMTMTLMTRSGSLTKSMTPHNIAFMASSSL